MERVQHLKIPLEEIKSATRNFSDENFIAKGGFGKVYIGKHSVYGKTVAVKRLDRTRGQGDREFLMEIQMLSCYKHQNLVSLIGFCEESGENILVYEHAKYGSLDRYLSDNNLSWMQRLKISLGAARGLSYLHNDVGPQHRVLHRDIKSSNILLNENWEAKISDFGLSKIGPSNVEFTFLVTDACGTLGYIDPQYSKTGILTKESDVYSFGVVLFELLCGRLALIKSYQDERRFLASLVQQACEQNRLREIILPGIENEIKVNSLNIFSTVAYQCLNENRSKRPTMAWIVEKLEEALKLQVNSKIAFQSRVQSLQKHKMLWVKLEVLPQWAFRQWISSGMVAGRSLAMSTFAGVSGRLPLGLPGWSDFVGRSKENNKIAGFIRVGTWGKQSGSPEDKWSFKLEPGQRMQKITIDHGYDVIYSLAFTSESGGVLHTSNKVGGSAGGQRVSEILLDFEEEIVGIYGSICTRKGHTIISSLSFETNKQTYGPFGRASEFVFSIPLDKGSLVGFYGFADHYIDGIGVYVKACDEIMKVGTWGASYLARPPNAWSFQLERNHHLKKITIDHSYLIYSLMFTTQYQGLTYTSEKAGGRNGRDIVSEVTFEWNEEINAIEGTSALSGDDWGGCTAISSISFVTNKRTHGPYGTVRGTPFTVPWDDGSFAGFYGLGEYYIEGIGVYLKAKK